MRVSVLDYGVGNLHSLANALAVAGAEVQVTEDPLVAIRAGATVLPGVGAFEPAAQRMGQARLALRDAIRQGLPTLGICLGMQLMFDASDEGPGMGLGVFAGRVTRLTARAVPHIGWNTLDDASDSLLDASGLGDVYYAHSYVCRSMDASVMRAWSTHESDRFPAVVRQGRAIGVQFHPEKSSTAGVAFLRAFLEEAHA